MADEAFVEILAQRVVEKLLARQKQALVVYTGSNIGEAAALEAMGRLRGEGFTFRVLLSRGASGLLDVERLRSVLEPEKLWVETPEALTARYDTILVPAMTVHTAAHVAACMADTPASAVILDGLMRGKNVVVNIDGCPLHGFEEDLAQKTHFEIVGHYLELYGYCEECRKKRG